ncbi:dynamin family protein [Ramlibacter sp. AW1]|uniref:Dynamin family protein n=1 Tax=Ramlibacter aurantiacus TaxID=2801330 RepID=A0A936ZVX2_9BURK|nr:dynamin family protein [Ramlibacter aurantiacus]
MTLSFKDQLDQHGAWRRDFALRLKRLSEWLGENELQDDGVLERLRRLEQQVRADKVMVAFVAEFSRGKSELINAIFFAGYKRRIMPASAGRTTMCPTELGWDPEVLPSLRLLPIETRLQPQGLSEWRQVPERWWQVELDVKDPAQLAQALEKVSEVNHVSLDQARELGFWHDDLPEDNPRLTSEGQVEIPRWRHALINIPHPLLKQGLVILDTPGLNAIGAEPELTVNLIPQAHAVVFILAAESGVTRSDMAIWRDHLSVPAGETDSRLVVLNKIDTLWDELSTPEQVQEQIDRQRSTSAEILGLPVERVIPVSAQKGLMAKITNDTDLLMASQLPMLELALAHGTLAQRQRILRAAVAAGVAELREEAAHAIQSRRRELAEQMVELKGLRGKNSAVIRHMQSRIEQEQAEFDESGARIHAVRSIHLKLLRQLMELLGTAQLRGEMSELTYALRQPGIKLGVKKAYGRTFDRLRANLQRARAISTEIHAMLGSAFRQLNAEHGFSLQIPREPDLQRFEHDIELVQRSHLQYLGVTNMLRMAQASFSDRVVRALTTRLRAIHEAALAEVELWNKSAAAQLDAQLRERRRNFARRIEAVDRIQKAAATLDDRITELAGHEGAVQGLNGRLAELTAPLLNPSATLARIASASSAEADDDFEPSAAFHQPPLKKTA